MRFANRLATLALLLAVNGVLKATGVQQQAYLPKSTLVAVVPTVDISGMKEGESKKQCKRLTEGVVKLFHERGFRITTGSIVEDAMKKQFIDLSDEEQRNRATMYRVGKELGADLVVFVLITDQRQIRGNGLIGEGGEPGSIKLWLLDSTHEVPIMSAKSEEDVNLMAAVDRTLKAFLKAYSRVPESERQVIH